MEKETTDIDFDNCFDVASNNVQQRQQKQGMLYNQNDDHRTQQSSVSRNILQQQQYVVPSQQSQRLPQRPPYDMLNWCTNEQSNQLNNPSSRMLNEQNNSFRRDYFYSATLQNNSACTTPITPQFYANQQQFNLSMMNKEEGIQYGYQKKNMMNNGIERKNYQISSTGNSMGVKSNHTNIVPVNKAGLPIPMSEVVNPNTQQSHTSVQISGRPNSSNTISHETTNVSPTSEHTSSLISSFTATEQWRKSNQDQIIPDCAVEDYRETRDCTKTIRSDSTTSSTTDLVAAAIATVTARTTAQTPMMPGRQLKKVAHNAIERRYRNNINDRISELKKVVPALNQAKNREKKWNSSDKDEDESADDENEENAGDDDIIEGVEVARKLNKATILHKATDYIHHLKHTNELAEQENQALQQILAQLPGGAKVLAHFQVQKCGYQQAEQQRLLTERKEAMEHERNERQRMLRERAAQRAVLAELFPKQERRPYSRRAKKQKIDIKVKTSPQNHAYSSEQDIQSEDSNTTPTNSNNKSFLALFMCIAMTSPSFERNRTGSHASARVMSHPQQFMAQSFPSTTPIDYRYCITIIISISLSAFFLLRYLNSKTAVNKKSYKPSHI